MCGPAGNKTTQVSTNQLPPWMSGQLSAYSHRAEQMTNWGYEPFGGQRIAGINGVQADAATQTSGIAHGFGGDRVGVRGSPAYIGATDTIAESGGLDSLAVRNANMSAYMNPYEAQVLEATNTDIDRATAQAQQRASGNAAMAGAFGGDRAAIEQAELAGQGIRAKASAAAELRQQGYRDAQTQAQTDISRRLAAVQQQGANNLQVALANQGENARFTGMDLQAQQSNQSAAQSAADTRLRGSSMLWQQGEADRQVQQARLDADYSQWLEAKNDPFNKLSWATGITTGAAPYFQKQENTTKTPEQGVMGQIMGMASMFSGALKRNGGVVNPPRGIGYAAGGSVGESWNPFYPAEDEVWAPQVPAAYAPVATGELSPSVQQALARLREQDAGAPVAAPSAAPYTRPTIDVDYEDVQRRDARAAMDLPLPPAEMPPPPSRERPPARVPVAPRATFTEADTSTDFEGRLRHRESGGRWDAVNDSGYAGAYQFGTARLADLGVYDRAPGEDLKRNNWRGSFRIPGFEDVRSLEDFRRSPDAQRAVMERHVANIDRAIDGTAGAETFNRDGLRAVAHLGGVGGMRRFVDSGGQYDPSDSNRTRLSNYYRHFGGQDVPNGSEGRAARVVGVPTAEALPERRDAAMVPNNIQAAAPREAGGISAALPPPSAEARETPEPERTLVGRIRNYFGVDNPEGRMALMQAGAAMMASRSPTALGGIGEGISAGLQSVQEGRYAASQSEARRLNAAANLARAQRAAPPPTVTTDEGIFLQNSDGTLGARIGGRPGNAPQPTELSRLRAERDALPSDSPDRALYTARIERLNAPPPSTSVNVDTRAESEEAKTRGKSLGEETERVRNAADNGASALDSIRQVRAVGAETGRLAPAQQVIGGYLDALGINSDLVRRASNLQAFNAAASSVVLSRQLEQKGAQTNRDAEIIRETFANPTNTMAANDVILRAAEAQALRFMERAEFYARWRTEPTGADGRPRGTVDGAAEAWNRNLRETPMVTRVQDRLLFLNEYLATAEQRGVDRETALASWRAGANRR